MHSDCMYVLEVKRLDCKGSTCAMGIEGCCPSALESVCESSFSNVLGVPLTSGTAVAWFSCVPSCDHFHQLHHEYICTYHHLSL